MSARTWAEIEGPLRLYLLTTGYSPESVCLYLCNVGLFARWASGHGLSLTHPSHRAVSTYLAERLTAVSPVTVRVQLHSLRAFFAFCRVQGWRQDNPTDGIHIKRPKTQPKRPYTIEQSRALVAACLNSRDRALLLVLADTGIRISELLRMETEDVDWAEGMVLIRGKGAKERYVLLGDTALGALGRCVNGRQGHLWLTRRGTPLKRAAARDMLRCVGRRAGVRPVGSHRFRITYANEFLETGGDIGALQVAMGHSDIRMTAHYAGYSANLRALEHQRRFSLGDKMLAHAPA